MTALLELKQKIKNLYGQYEIYILPVLRCILAFLYFTWINVNMGYMSQLNNIFIVLILALICSILPSGVMIFAGFALMIAHGYALGAEVAGFLLLLILFMLILFLRFSAGTNLVLVFTPLSFGFSIPALLPIGSGLLSSAVSALPAGCGVIVYYFIRFLNGYYMLQIRILRKWEAFKIGQASTRCFTGALSHGDFIWFWQLLLDLCCM